MLYIVILAGAVIAVAAVAVAEYFDYRWQVRLAYPAILI